MPRRLSKKGNTCNQFQFILNVVFRTQDIQEKTHKIGTISTQVDAIRLRVFVVFSGFVANSPFSKAEKTVLRYF